MKNLIHVKTVVQSVFGEVDSDGDVIKTYPYSLEVQKLTEENFKQLLSALLTAKAQLVKE